MRYITELSIQTMQTQWYGDKRDVLKWATLIHLCKQRGLSAVLQVLFLTDVDLNHDLRIDGQLQVLPKSVWNHFRSLDRIKELGREEKLEIHILDDPFRHDRREAYIDRVCERVGQLNENPKAVFLDPDTGIAPDKSSERHVTVKEIEKVWKHLKKGDWLVLYQHASRDKNWRAKQRKKFMTACGGAAVSMYESERIAHDVVFYCAEQKS